MNKKYFIQNYGCQMNYSDSERFSSVFEEAGYEKADKIENADLVLINTCSVRQRAEDRVDGLKDKIFEIRNKNKEFRVILTGCMTKRQYRTEPNVDKRKENERKYSVKLRRRFPWVNLIINVDELPEIYSFLGLDKPKIAEYLSIKPKYDSSFQAFVPISTGCNNFCSYCIVPLTRGEEKSRPFKEIVHEVTELIHIGYKEITLLGQNVNSYGNDLGEKDSFPRLLAEIDKIEGDYWIKFISSHPKDISIQLIKVIKNAKHITHMIHFALQSGSNEILKKMNRPYTIEKYLELVKMIRTELPGVAITTDIIVGFPGETEEDLEKTAEAMEKAKFSMAFLNQYSSRKGTLSEKKYEDNVPQRVKNNRKNYLNKILTKTAREFNSRYLNNKIKVLITKVEKGNTFGHTEHNVDVRVHGEYPEHVGKFTNVNITEIGSWNLEGEII